MKLATYKDQNGTERIGAVCGDRIIALADIGFAEATMQELIRNTDPAVFAAAEAKNKLQAALDAGKSAPLADVTLLAPIPHPAQDVLCLGINYMDHAAESARARNQAFDGKREQAVYFSKRVNEATGDKADIPLHADITSRLDYESEFAVILGKDADHVSREDAWKYIFGYTIVNDVSARDVQNLHQQWHFGKSLSGCCPMGPWIVTVDEFACPPAVGIRSYVNGELRQNSNTELLIFGVDFIIEELSQGMVLQAGSIISTGTPSGVGMGMNPPQFLKDGDEVVCEIDGIGRLTNTVRA